MSTAMEQRAEAIIDQLLELPVADRAMAAERACDGDADLLDRVRSLLSALPMLDGFMSEATVAPPVVARVTERPGTIIGRYKLLQQIGEGGFGVVFMAEQEKPVRRTVALKVIKLGMDTHEVVARFEAERQALALMDHPNIAKVLDAGATDTGRPYFVMELVRGLAITEYADKKKLSTTDRVALLAQVCRAVQHAHSKGIIHRDLKPSNVLVTTADDKPVPKVIDFGIAKATQSRLTDRTLFTRFRQLIGTPQYMSPEQADSEGVDVDTRTDVYSLGVLLYELLVGTTPLDARQLRSAAYEEIRRQIRDAEPPNPSTRLHTLANDQQNMIATARSSDAKKLGQAIHGELDWIVMRALEKDRTRRYESAAALADDLSRYLAGDAVLAGPVSGTYRLKKTLKRHKAAVAIGGAIAICLLLGIAGTSIGLVQATHQRNLAQRKQVEADQARSAAIESERKAVASAQEAQRQKTLAEAERKDALAQKATADEKSAEATATLDFFTNDVLAKASPNNTRDAKVSKVLVDALIMPALKTIDQRFKDQPLVRASIQHTLADTLLGLGRADLAEPQAKAAWQTRRRVLGDEHPDTLIALNNYATAVHEQGRYAEAAPLFKQIWDTFRRVEGDEHPHTLSALNNYAMAVNAQGRYAEAERLNKQLWDASRRVLGDDQPDTLMALNNYAAAVNEQGRHAEAERLDKQLWDARRRVQGDDHPDTLTALNNYAMAVHEQGRYAEAEQLYKQLWDASRRVQGDDHPDTLRALNNYAAAVDEQGRHAEAERLDKQVWDARRRVQGDDHPDTLMALNNYARTVNQQGRHAEAERLFKQVWDASRRVLGDDHPHTLMALNNYAAAVHEQGRYAESERLFKQCWDARRRSQGDDHPDTLWALEEYALAVNAQGHHAKAEQLYKQLWDASRRVRGDDYPDTQRALGNYAVAVDQQGRHAEAEPLFKQLWDTSRRVRGGEDPDTLCALEEYAWAVDAQGRHAEAEPLLRQAADMFRRVRPDDPNRGTVLFGLGQCLAAQKKWPQAESVLRENYAWDQAHPSPDRKPGTGSLKLLNQCLKAQGKPTEPTTAPAAPGTGKP